MEKHFLRTFIIHKWDEDVVTTQKLNSCNKNRLNEEKKNTHIFCYFIAAFLFLLLSRTRCLLVVYVDLHYGLTTLSARLVGRSVGLSLIVAAAHSLSTALEALFIV